MSKFPPHQLSPGAADLSRRSGSRTPLLMALSMAAAVSIGTVSAAATAVAEETTESVSPLEEESNTPVTTLVADTTTSTSTTTTTTIVVPSLPDQEPTTKAANTQIPPTTTTTLAPASVQQHVTVYPSQLAHILATIRYLESRGDYTLAPNKGNASGAYQFIGSTWDNHAGYSNASLAPPEVQDSRAAFDVIRFLARWNNDVSMIPVMWYYPRAASDPALMDIVPVPSAGNVLTVREYQQRWLGVWAFISGRPVPQPLSFADSIRRLGVPPETHPSSEAPSGESDELANIAFPVLGPTRIAAPECGTAEEQVEGADEGASALDVEAAGLCAATPPGIIFGVKLQPVLAVVDGIVTAVNDQPGETISVTITDESGRSYTMAGLNDDNPGTNDGAAPPYLRLSALGRVGATVRAGQVIGFMGDTDPIPIGVRSDVPTDATVNIPTDAIAPHIRLTIKNLDGSPVDAYGPVIDALFRQVCTIGTGPWSGPPNGEGHLPVTIETTDNDRQIDSEWIITSEGQVTANGWAAMIHPGDGCSYAPPEARGPGAGGFENVPASWWYPIDLPTSMWVDLAVQGDDLTEVPVLLR
jgi:hypothetical protein